jgi:hypothetical protein
LNNKAEYEALIFGLFLALSMDIWNLLAYGEQINGIYEVRKPELVPYYKAVQIRISSSILTSPTSVSAPRLGARPNED